MRVSPQIIDLRRPIRQTSPRAAGLEAVEEGVQEAKPKPAESQFRKYIRECIARELAELQQASLEEPPQPPKAPQFRLPHVKEVCETAAFQKLLDKRDGDNGAYDLRSAMKSMLTSWLQLRPDAVDTTDAAYWRSYICKLPLAILNYLAGLAYKLPMVMIKVIAPILLFRSSEPALPEHGLDHLVLGAICFAIVAYKACEDPIIAWKHLARDLTQTHFFRNAEFYTGSFKSDPEWPILRRSLVWQTTVDLIISITAMVVEFSCSVLVLISTWRLLRQSDNVGKIVNAAAFALVMDADETVAQFRAKLVEEKEIADAYTTDHAPAQWADDDDDWTRLCRRLPCRKEELALFFDVASAKRVRYGRKVALVVILCSTVAYVFNGYVWLG